MLMFVSTLDHITPKLLCRYFLFYSLQACQPS